MSSGRALLRNSAVLFAGTVAAKGLVFVSYLVLTQTLGPEGFGRYVFVFTALAFFELLADAGLDPLLVREGTRPGHDVRRDLGDALVLRFGLTVLVAVLAAILVPKFSGRPEDGPLVLLASATLLATNRRPSLRSILEVPSRLRLRMELPTALGAATEAVALLLLVLLAARAGVAGAILAQPLAQIPFAILFAALLAPADRPRFDLEPARLGSLLHRASPLLGALALNIVLVRADVLFLEVMRGSHEVGIYAAPVRLVEIANLLPALVVTSLFPLLANAFEAGRREEAARLYGASVRFLQGALVPFVLVQWIAAPWIVETLFGPEFAASAAILPWLAIAELLLFLDILIGARLVAQRQERLNLLMLGAAAAFNLAGNTFAIPAYGAVGAAVVTVGSYATRLAAGYAASATRGAVVESVRASTPAWIAGAIAAAAAFAATKVGARSGVALLVALATYAITLPCCRGVRAADIAFARSLLPRRGPARHGSTPPPE